jgi:hypothetical protein
VLPIKTNHHGVVVGADRDATYEVEVVDTLWQGGLATDDPDPHTSPTIVPTKVGMQRAGSGCLEPPPLPMPSSNDPHPL